MGQCGQAPFVLLAGLGHDTLQGDRVLVDRQHAGRRHEMRPECLVRPFQQRIPGSGLGGDQFGRVQRTEAQQVRRRIAGHFRHGGLQALTHPVQGDEAEAGRRHGGGIDPFPLHVPLRRDQLGQAFRRNFQRHLGRGLHRPPIQAHGEAGLCRLHGHGFVETFRAGIFRLGQAHAGLGFVFFGHATRPSTEAPKASSAAFSPSKS